MTRRRFELYCRCGAALSGHLDDSPAAVRVLSAWSAAYESHEGDGHGMATRYEAARARLRAAVEE